MISSLKPVAPLPAASPGGSSCSRAICAEHIKINGPDCRGPTVEVSAVVFAAPVLVAATAVPVLEVIHAAERAQQPGRAQQRRPHQERQAIGDTVVLAVAFHDASPLYMSRTCIYMC